MERGSDMRAALISTVLAVAAMGCSDSSRPSIDGGSASQRCDARDRPMNDVFVADSSGARPSDQPGPCTDGGFCEPKQIWGVVTAMGRDYPLGNEFPDDWKPEKPRWIKIDDGDHFWTVASHNLPDFAVGAGSTVSASYFLLRGGFTPDLSALELRVGGKLAFYYGFAGNVDHLMRPPELAIARRDATCTTVDTCLMWSEYDLEMSLNGSKPVTLGTGESKVVGDYELKNFRSAESSGDSRCSDAFVADTTVLVARTSPLSEAPALDAGLEDDAGGGEPR